MKYLLFFILLVGVYAEDHYNGYKVYRITPTTDEQLQSLREWENNLPEFDFWKGASIKNVPVDIMVAPHLESQFNDILKRINTPSKVYIEDVQGLIDETTKKHKGARAFDWTDYHRGTEIDAWLNSLAAQYPDKVQTVVGGKSYEGRTILGVKISFKSGNKAVMIEAGIHAREWIGPATATYIINQLLTSTDANVRDIAESYDWYVFPSVNPDGYEYTHTTSRLWRKTRKPHGLLCKGADPNRNWGYHWMNGGASSIPCSDTYAGPEAFSEDETKSLSEFVTSIHENLIGYIGLHSYSQLLLIPYGDSSAHVENFDELYDIGKKAAASLAQRYGTQYTVGNIVEVIYVASGGSMDWVKGTYHTPITYTYELRDTGRHGFVLPPEQIIPTGEETLDSLVTIMQEAKARGYK